MDFLQNHIESIIFCAQEPVKIEEIRQTLSEMFEAEVPEEDVVNAVEALLTKYESDHYSFMIYRISGGFQFLTKPAYQSSLSIFLKQKSKKRLSTSALETIAIIAYKQPITKTEIEQIRGVNCDYAIQKLLEKELIDIKGKSDGVGRPILYGTSSRFMEYFGINSLKDLPTIKDYSAEQNMIGEVNDPAYVSENIEGQDEISMNENASVDHVAAEAEGETENDLPENGGPHNESNDSTENDNEQETL